MFEKSYSGKWRLMQVYSSIWRSTDWTITLVLSVLEVRIAVTISRIATTMHASLLNNQ